MLTALPLCAYAVAVALIAPRILLRGWAVRMPNLGLLAWHAAVWSSISALVWAILVVAPLVWVPLISTTLHIDASLAERAYSSAALALDGLLLIGLVVVARTAWVWHRESRLARDQRHEHRIALAATGVTEADGPLRGVRVIDYEAPAAFCVPGGRNPIIAITSGAVRRLTPSQTQAVLAHERAHLRFRHHWFIMVADTITRALSIGGKPALFREYGPQVRRLSEMAADDAAARQFSDRDLVRALVELSAPGPARPGVLSVQGSPIVERVNRIMGRRAATTWRMHIGGALLAGAVITAPAVLAWAPAIHLAGSDHCVEQCTHGNDTTG